MKDRFVKVMLVVIAGLLFLNCVKDMSFTNSNSPTNSPTTSRNGSAQSPNSTKTSFIETSVEAAPVPAFIQVGKSYHCSGGFAQGDYKVTKIDKDSGWVEIDNKRWLNMSLVGECE